MTAFKLASSSLILALTGGLSLTSSLAMADTEKAVFAGGCFWCMEEAFDKVDGVLETTSGYIGGDTDNPTYKEVSAGGTHHAEAVEVGYDTDVVSYDDLLYVFWRNIDPFVENRQFCDSGDSYRSALFPIDDGQRETAEASKAAVAELFDDAIATEINAPATFYPAEEYHQNYYQKNPVRYRLYKNGCGRPDRLEEIWGDEASPSVIPDQAHS